MNPAFSIDVHYKQMGILLKELQHSLEIGESILDSQTWQRIQTTYHAIEADIQQMSEAAERFAKELVALQDKVEEEKRSPPYRKNYFSELLIRYTYIQQAGGTPILIYKVAKLEQVPEAFRLRLLTTLFGLSFKEAQALSKAAAE